MKTAAVFDQTFEQRLAKLNLTQVMARVAHEHNLHGKALARAEQLYRQYLTLLDRFPDQQLVPPVIVDYVWDAHVVHTQQYAADCEMLFGRFVHHVPHSQDEDMNPQYETFTVPAYMSEFGEDMLTARVLEPVLYAAAHCGP